MRVVHLAEELEPASASGRVLVPTMGALHAGHVSLIREGRKYGSEVVVSIFVNPTQFGAGEDFDRYPRPTESDLEQAEKAGADIVFMPSVAEIYPHGQDGIRVQIGGVGTLWEGAQRPGHFDGVATVVAKLFGAVRPTVALFGEKDLQQCQVVKRLIAELRLGIEMIIAPTVRDTDGLALSSRNAYLGPAERAEAPQLFAMLLAVRSQLLAAQPDQTTRVLQQAISQLSSSFKVEYFALVDATTMEPTETLSSFAHLIVAAKIGSTRLIDNLAIAAR